MRSSFHALLQKTSMLQCPNRLCTFTIYTLKNTSAAFIPASWCKDRKTEDRSWWSGLFTRVSHACTKTCGSYRDSSVYYVSNDVLPWPNTSNNISSSYLCINHPFNCFCYFLPMHWPVWVWPRFLAAQERWLSGAAIVGRDNRKCTLLDRAQGLYEHCTVDGMDLVFYRYGCSVGWWIS